MSVLLEAPQVPSHFVNHPTGGLPAQPAAGMSMMPAGRAQEAMPGAQMQPAFGSMPLRPFDLHATRAAPAVAAPPAWQGLQAQPVSAHPGAQGTVTGLMSALSQAPPEAAHEVPGLDTLRMQMFGSYHEELEGRMRELRSSFDGTLARNRRLITERMDELGAALHRDMVALRQETQKELEDLKRDLFSAVMSISALNDKLGMTDSRFRETWLAVMKTLTDRIDNQAAGLAATIKGVDARVETLIEERVGALVERKLVQLASARRAQQIAATGTAEQTEGALQG